MPASTGGGVPSGVWLGGFCVCTRWSPSEPATMTLWTTAPMHEEALADVRGGVRSLGSVLVAQVRGVPTSFAQLRASGVLTYQVDVPASEVRPHGLYEVMLSVRALADDAVQQLRMPIVVVAHKHADELQMGWLHLVSATLDDPPAGAEEALRQAVASWCALLWRSEPPNNATPLEAAAHARITADALRVLGLRAFPAHVEQLADAPDSGGGA